MHARHRKSALWREIVWYGWVTGTLLILAHVGVAKWLGLGVAELFGV